MKDARNKMQKKTTRSSASNQNKHAGSSTQSSQPIKDIASNIGLVKKLNEPFTANNVQSKKLQQAAETQPKESDMANDNHAKVSPTTKQTDPLQTIMLRQVEGKNITHPNFDDNQSQLDPNRSLQDLPAPVARYKQELDELLASNTPLKKQSSINTAINYHHLPTQLRDKTKSNSYEDNGASMWSLIATPELASHLELLQLGGLIQLPEKFFKPVILAMQAAHKSDKQGNQSSTVFNDHVNKHDGKDNKQVNKHNSIEEAYQTKDVSELLSPLTQMQLLDLSDIYQVYDKYPELTRYGFTTQGSINNSDKRCSQDNEASNNTSNHKINNKPSAIEIPEIINDIFSPNWELILYPERFDNGVDSLATDVLACSVAVHILKQCPTRKTVNRRFTVEQICQHMRGYVLSQCKLTPQFEQQYRQIRLFVGHVIVALDYLGFDVVHSTQHKKDSQDSTAQNPNSQNPNPKNLNVSPQQNSGQPVYTNISSRASLLTRYPDITSYYINGWS